MLPETEEGTFFWHNLWNTLSILSHYLPRCSWELNINRGALVYCFSRLSHPSSLRHTLRSRPFVSHNLAQFPFSSQDFCVWL